MDQSQVGQLIQQMQNFAGQVNNALGAMHGEIRKVRARLAGLEATESLRREGREARYPIEFRSQFGEDVTAWELLGGQTKGFFIECGAFDGYHYSVTYALEAMGWNGLLVEALPKCSQECTARRKHSRVVNAALGRRGSSGTTSFTVVDDQYGGMLSFMKQDTEHAQRLKKEGAPMRQLTVPFTTMDLLLMEHQGPIDLAVIDVEGAELDLLDGFDLARHKPRVLFLEDNTRGGVDAGLTEFMKRQPYVEIGRLEVNRIFVHKNERAILERAQA